MKAYYTETGNAQAIVNNSTSKDDAKTITKVLNDTDELKNSADALLALKDKGDYTEAVKTFADNYNAVINSMDHVNSTSILSRTVNLTNLTQANSKLLSEIGITINSDNTLSVNEDILKEANAATVKSLFQGTGSYAYRVSAQASLINFAAEQESRKSNTYSFTGAYSNNLTSGNIYNSFF